VPEGRYPPKTPDLVITVNNSKAIDIKNFHQLQAMLVDTANKQLKINRSRSQKSKSTSAAA